MIDPRLTLVLGSSTTQWIANSFYSDDDLEFEFTSSEAIEWLTPKTRKVLTVGVLNVRMTPNKLYPQIAQLPDNTPLTVGVKGVKAAGYTWVRIIESPTQVVGWVADSYLKDVI